MLLISQLSKETGIAIHTIRFYEKFGLIKGQKNPEVKSNNYHYYDEEVVYKLGLVNDAKSAGFTLSEIKKLIDAWYSKRISQSKKIEILDDKIIEIEAKIKQLKDIKKQIAFLKKEVEEKDC
jgi:MerR family transcriptional regulator, copper efflux regulator